MTDTWPFIVKDLGLKRDGKKFSMENTRKSTVWCKFVINWPLIPQIEERNWDWTSRNSVVPF